MPLLDSVLKSDIENAFKNGNLAPMTAIKFSQAIVNFFNSGMAPGLGIINASVMQADLTQKLIDLWNSYPPTSSLAALKTAQAINIVLSSAIISGGTFGTGYITGLDLGTLQSLLENIYLAQSSTVEVMADSKSKAIKLFTQSGTCFGTGIPPTFIPQIGPIS